MAKICFYTSTNINRLKFEQYTSNDIKILRELGHEVVLASNIFQIPFDCQLIYSWWLTASVIPSIFSIFIRVPLIVVSGGNASNVFIPQKYKKFIGYYSLSFLKKIAVKISIMRASYILCVSNYLNRSVRIISPSAHKKLKTVYLCVDSDKFKSIKSNFKFNNITAIASFDNESIKVKRIYLIIESFYQAWLKEKNLRFTFIGRKGEKFDEINNYLSKLFPKNVYKIYTDLDNENIVKIFQRTSVYCQFSLVETFGLAAAEALSSGSSLLLSKVGALEEIFKGKATFIKDINKIEDISNNIIRLNKIGNQKDLSKLNYLNIFSFQRRKQKIKNIIDKTIKNYEKSK